MSGGVALLDAQTATTPHDEPWARCIDIVDVYDLGRVDLGRYSGVVVEGMVDQEHLYRQRHQIGAYLDGGGLIVWSGQLFRPWLPGCGPFVPKEIRSFRDYAIRVVRPHPVFDGVDPEDLTLRRGVAGFFARGHHPPPEGAEVLLSLAEGEPVVYVDRTTTKGTVFAHAGTGLLRWAEPGSTAARISPQLLAWVQEGGGR
ncbi:MAG: phosphate starvation-inducible protein PhoH [Acidimicrobiales bacterium]